MGINTIEKYENQIKWWFKIGREHPGKNMNADMMRKTKKIAEHSKYILPSEQQIVAKISTLYRNFIQKDSRKTIKTYCTIVYKKEDDRNNTDCPLGMSPALAGNYDVIGTTDDGDVVNGSNHNDRTVNEGRCGSKSTKEKSRNVMKTLYSDIVTEIVVEKNTIPPRCFRPKLMDISSLQESTI